MRRLLTLALALAACPPAAARPTRLPAPDFPVQAVWLNARDMTLARLKGRRVLLVAFINAANINSLRALEALKAWDRRYALDGLMVIGVHAPQYGFQKDPAYVREAVRRLGVEFPVILDNERALWKAYANDGWPAFYLIDHKGSIVFDHFGESGYEALEYAIQGEIEKLRGAPPPGGLPSVSDPPPLGDDCGVMTPEIDLGARRGRVYNLDLDELPNNQLLGPARDGEVATRGRWVFEPDDLKLNQQNADQSASIRVVFRGARGFAVLGPGDAGAVKFWVRLDGGWLDRASAGRDVRFDADGRSFVEIKTPGMREVVHGSADNVHELSIAPMRIGGRIYAFSFNNKCLKVSLP